MRRNRKITDDEINEYIVKKAVRKANRVAKKLKSNTSFGYSSESNPFGDSNLNDKFVWRKKIERDVANGVPMDFFTLNAEKQRQKMREVEIEKLKKRKVEREAKKRQLEEDMVLLARKSVQAEANNLVKKEEEFLLRQNELRSRIRLREGRMKPIDTIVKQFVYSDGHELSEPYEVFMGLTTKEMEELHEDIKFHLSLDTSVPTRVEYWEALLVVCDWELAEARKRDVLDLARVRGQELLAEQRGLHSSIETDVREFLDRMSYEDLEVLQSQIEFQMSSGKAKVVEYWEVVLKYISFFMAKALLRERHHQMLRNHLKLHEQHPEVTDNFQTEILRGTGVAMEHDTEDAQALSKASCPNEACEEEEEESGSFSPKLIYGCETEDAVDPVKDKALLERKRLIVQKEQHQRLQDAALVLNPLSEDESVEEGDEAVLGSVAVVNLGAQVYWWHDKHRPRKPKYLSRVHTGYEWSKYNQTHYDQDNPPPKAVQGYKFNVFYPDLINPNEAPTYFIEKDGNNADTCILRFHAGPPYEDIAFRIVNKEWELSHKKGFKSTFERGTLQLYFNFKRYRYRR